MITWRKLCQTSRLMHLGHGVPEKTLLILTVPWLSNLKLPISRLQLSILQHHPWTWFQSIFNIPTIQCKFTTIALDHGQMLDRTWLPLSVKMRPYLTASQLIPASCMYSMWLKAIKSGLFNLLMILLRIWMLRDRFYKPQLSQQIMKRLLYSATMIIMATNLPSRRLTMYKHSDSMLIWDIGPVLEMKTSKAVVHISSE